MLAAKLGNVPSSNRFEKEDGMTRQKYSHRIFKVFVASPSDVADERALAFQVIDDINMDELLPREW